MKVRLGFVTNSSSSSFIVSKEECSEKTLKRLLIEVANIDNDYYECEHYTEEDYCQGVGRYHVLDSDMGDIEELAYWFDCEKDDIPNGKWLINNDTYSRYDWENIEDVFGKEGISIGYGHCS